MARSRNRWFLRSHNRPMLATTMPSSGRPSCWRAAARGECGRGEGSRCELKSTEVRWCKAASARNWFFSSELTARDVRGIRNSVLARLGQGMMAVAQVDQRRDARCRPSQTAWGAHQNSLLHQIESFWSQGGSQCRRSFQPNRGRSSHLHQAGNGRSRKEHKAAPVAGSTILHGEWPPPPDLRFRPESRGCPGATVWSLQTRRSPAGTGFVVCRVRPSERGLRRSASRNAGKIPATGGAHLNFFRLSRSS
jgi:hypothetical protein